MGHTGKKAHEHKLHPVLNQLRTAGANMLPDNWLNKFQLKLEI